VFKLAKQQGYYTGENPVRATATSPKAAEPQETSAYDLSKIQQMPLVMPEPAATIFAVAAFTGLRRSELQGLRWEDYQGSEIRVSRAIWEGHVNDPKTGRSKGAVPVIKQVADRLEFHRLRYGNKQQGPMFPNGKKQPSPLCLNNVLNRQILPALKRCEHRGKAQGEHAEAKHDFKLGKNFPTWRGWHAARRGTRKQSLFSWRSGKSHSADSSSLQCEHNRNLLHQDGSGPGDRCDGKATASAAGVLIWQRTGNTRNRRYGILCR